MGGEQRVSFTTSSTAYNSIRHITDSLCWLELGVGRSMDIEISRVGKRRTLAEDRPGLVVDKRASGSDCLAEYIRRFITLCL